MGTLSPQSSSAAPLGETIIFSATKAVVELSEAAGAKTQTQLAVICSLAARRGVTDIPSGSIPATGDAVLGSQNAVQSYDLNQTPNEPEFTAVISTPLPGVGTHFSTVDLCTDVDVNVTEKADDDRASFFRAMCDELPRNASLLLPNSAQDILKKKTPHSDTKTAPAGQEEENAPLGQHDRATAEDQ